MESSKAASDAGGRGYAALYLSVLSILLCFVASVLYVRSFGVNVFFADEWDLVPLLREAHAGTLGTMDLFAHHNEHIYLFPWGLMLLLGPMTNYDTVPFMYGVQLCFLLTSVVLLLAFAQDAKDKSRAYFLLFLPLPFLVFTFRQYENMLWGNQISFGLAQSFSVLAMYALHVSSGAGFAKRAGPFCTALLCATVATFSAAQSLMVWPAGLLLLAVSPLSRTTKGVFAAGWALLGIAESILYLAGYDRPKGVPSAFYAAGHPLEGLRYFATLLGSALFWNNASAFWVGLTLLFLTAIGLFLLGKRREIEGSAFWVSLLAFSFLSMALITAGRSGFPDEAVFAQPTASRYVTFSVVAVAALYAIFAKLVWQKRSVVASVLFSVVLVLVGLSVPISYHKGLEAGRSNKAASEYAVSVLINYRSEPTTALRTLGWDPQHVRRYARVLDRLNQSVFADMPASGGRNAKRSQPSSTRPHHD
jgi:hypothetical protein